MSGTEEVIVSSLGASNSSRRLSPAPIPVGYRSSRRSTSHVTLLASQSNARVCRVVAEHPQTPPGCVDALAGHDDLLLVADAGNHRILGWSPQPDGDRPADILLGQGDFAASEEWPYGPHTGDRFRFPYAVGLDGDGSAERLAVADTANNRILLWDGVPTDGKGADHVLAQPDFASNGENRWTSVQPDTLCWPYGLSLRGDRVRIDAVSGQSAQESAQRGAIIKFSSEGTLWGFAANWWSVLWAVERR